MNIHSGQGIVLDSEGDSEPDKGLFAHEMVKRLRRKDDILRER